MRAPREEVFHEKCHHFCVSVMMQSMKKAEAAVVVDDDDDDRDYLSSCYCC